MLLPPNIANSIPKTSSRNLHLNPVIYQRLYSSGRNFDPIITPSGQLAVACLRGIDLFNIATAGKIELIRSLDTPGHAWSATVIDNSLWVADGYAGITIMDCDAKNILKRLPQFDNTRCILRVRDNLVLICRHRLGATLVSTETNTNPSVVSHFLEGIRVISATVSGNTLYLGTIKKGYFAFDITDPSNPKKLWVYQKPERITWCRLLNGIHYLTDRDDGLWALKDHGSQQPDFISKLQLPSKSRRAAFYSDNVLMVASAESLIAIDIDQPESMQEITSFQASNEGRGIINKSERIFFSDGDYGVVELTFDGSSFIHLSTYHRHRLLTDLVIKDNYCFATNTFDGVKISRILPDQSLEHVTSVTGLHHAVGIDIACSIAAVVDYDGLSLIDVSNPAKPVILSHSKTPGRAAGIDVTDKYAYVADWFEGLHIIDITDRVNPVIISSTKLKGWAIDVSVNNNYAYVCCVNGGLFTVDIHNPESPFITDFETTSIAPEGITIVQDVMYITDFNSGLLIYQIQSPDKPEPLKHYPLDVCKGVQARGNLLLVSNYIYGLKIFDISDPLSPVMIGELDTPGKAYEAVFIPGKPNDILIADWHGLLYAVLSEKKINDNAALPTVLIIGDSISIGYTEPLIELMKGKATVTHNPGNALHSGHGLDNLDKWLGDTKWDVIHFNHGLHDLKYVDEYGKSTNFKENGHIQLPLTQYEKNMKAIVIRLKKTGAKLIFATTTPYPAGVWPLRRPEDAVKYNAVALKIMSKYGIIVNDLYSYALPQLKKLQKTKDVHFTGEGSKALAQEVARHILKAIGQHKNLPDITAPRR